MNKYLGYMLCLIVLVGIGYFIYAMIKESGLIHAIIIISYVIIYQRYWDKLKNKYGWKDQYNIKSMTCFLGIGVIIALILNQISLNMQ